MSASMTKADAAATITSILPTPRHSATPTTPPPDLLTPPSSSERPSSQLRVQSPLLDHTISASPDSAKVELATELVNFWSSRPVEQTHVDRMAAKILTRMRVEKGEREAARESELMHNGDRGGMEGNAKKGKGKLAGTGTRDSGIYMGTSDGDSSGEDAQVVEVGDTEVPEAEGAPGRSPRPAVRHENGVPWGLYAPGDPAPEPIEDGQAEDEEDPDATDEEIEEHDGNGVVLGRRVQIMREEETTEAASVGISDAIEAPRADPYGLNGTRAERLAGHQERARACLAQIKAGCNPADVRDRPRPRSVIAAMIAAVSSAEFGNRMRKGAGKVVPVPTASRGRSAGHAEPSTAVPVSGGKSSAKGKGKSRGNGKAKALAPEPEPAGHAPPSDAAVPVQSIPGPRKNVRPVAPKGHLKKTTPPPPSITSAYITPPASSTTSPGPKKTKGKRERDVEDICGDELKEKVIVKETRCGRQVWTPKKMND